MKILKLFVFVGLSLLFLNSCQDDRDDNITNINELANQEDIKDYMWKAMNTFYVYKSDSPDLADDRFENTPEYRDFLSSIKLPTEFFNSLLADQDRYSFLVSDFVTLEQNLDGISLDNGMAFGLIRFIGTNTVFGYVRYVIPGSPADSAGLERGMIFNRIDGIIFSPDTDFNPLLNPASYTLGLAELQGGDLVQLDQEVALNKVQLTENPIHDQRVLDIEGLKIGYLMYNNFRTPFNTELNAVFANFASEGISDLVLDLRYNSGGSIETAKDLSSMITGQFNDQVFAQQLFNANFEPRNLIFDNQINTGEAINNLNLSRVFILTTGSSASASELVINALNPYIDVVQIGDTTEGKFEGSATLYDSEDYTRNNVSLEHTYAIQPLILKTANKDGFTDFFDGLDPDIELNESFSNLGILGDPNETLLNRALQEIIPGFAPTSNESKSIHSIELLGEDDMSSPSFQRMYIEYKNK
ncbi:C-terminal processing serine protease, peptidase_S41 superfamily [Psychroflexus torquis ATCC 700755]|uniref:C-terminal processing serine protease, peptidase_S41 superfamily n=1 Tax=Psychroflexus torquis (strain ATCC 700755 / CIP 106069 / ACAM 623) TaxID=313595 RepID=K4I9Z4_PSYTT|nr:S41 family peptidase [Psychroflexus torquis]AFU67244.1 C-terminal processing serine protease, peptidase_S41 superfamily [Psychroflexus torquis ATCC 700755]